MTQKEQKVVSELLHEVDDKSLQNIFRKIIFSDENPSDVLLHERPELTKKQ